MKFSQFFSLITFSIFALVAAAPTNEYEVMKREVSGADILNLVEELVSGVNGLTSYTKQAKWSRSAASDDFTNAVSSVKTTADDFSSSCGSYDISLDPIGGLVGAVLSLVGAVVGLVVQVYLWVLFTGINIVEEVVAAIFQLVFIILHALLPFTSVGAFGALGNPLSNGLSFVENVCQGFGIQI